MHTIAVTEISPVASEREGCLEKEKLEPDILGKAVADTETRGEGWTVALGEKRGALRTPKRNLTWPCWDFNLQ